MNKILKTAFLTFSVACGLGLAACGGSNATTEYKETMDSILEADAKYFVTETVNELGVSDKEGQFLSVSLNTEEEYPLGFKIPSKIDGKDVIKIANSAFDRTDVVLVSVPQTIKYIGIGAFSGSDLQEIEFQGEGLVSAAEYAFSGTKLENIKFPETLTDLGSYALAGCHNLETVTFADNFSVIPEFCFNGTSSLKTVTSNGATKISQGAFANSGIKTYQVPNGVLRIEDGAFKSCTSLTSLTFTSEATLSVIRPDAFNGCVKLNNVILPDTVTYIGTNAFANCAALETITFGESVSLGKDVFANTPYQDALDAEVTE